MTDIREAARKDLLERSPYASDGGELIGARYRPMCLTKFSPATTGSGIL
jgi:hypothetical protein